MSLNAFIKTRRISLMIAVWLLFIFWWIYADGQRDEETK